MNYLPVGDFRNSSDECTAQEFDDGAWPSTIGRSNYQTGVLPPVNLTIPKSEASASLSGNITFRYHPCRQTRGLPCRSDSISRSSRRVSESIISIHIPPGDASVFDAHDGGEGGGGDSQIHFWNSSTIPLTTQ